MASIRNGLSAWPRSSRGVEDPFGGWSGPRVLGSVSGGCVEGAVYALKGEALASGTGKNERYGIADDEAFAVGLTRPGPRTWHVMQRRRCAC